MKKITFIFFIFSITPLFSQKKIITEDAYAEWQTISKAQLSQDGKKFVYTTHPYEGNDQTFLMDMTKEEYDPILTIRNANKAHINKNSTFLTALIHADYDKVRKLKIKKTKSYKMPKDTLLVYDFASDKSFYLPNVANYVVLDSVNLIVGKFAHDFKVNKEAQLSKKKNEKVKEGIDTKSYNFFIYNPSNGLSYQRTGIKNYYVDKEQQLVILSFEKKKQGRTIQWLEKIAFSDLKPIQLKSEFSKIESLYADSKNSTIFLLGKLAESVKKPKKGTPKEKKDSRNDLMSIHLDFSSVHPLKLADKEGLDSSFIVSTSSEYTRLPNGDWLLDIQRKKPKEEKDTLLTDEKVSLDIWSWKDAQIQPMQLKKAEKYYTDKFKVNLSWDMASSEIKMIENDTFSIYSPFKDASFTLGRSSIRYDSVMTYAYPWYADYYKVNLLTGEKELILERNSSRPLMTPDGKYLYFESDVDTNFYMRDLTTDEDFCITSMIHERWVDDLNGMDFVPSMEGQKLLDANKTEVWFRSTKALYRYNASQRELKRITPENWLSRNIQLNFSKIETDSAYFNRENIIINVFDKDTKINHYYSLTERDELEIVAEGAFEIIKWIRDNHQHRYLVRKQTNEQYPDYFILKIDKYRKITDANPQQAEYNWSTVEPVKWTAYDGQELEGLLYKPEDFDSSKSYPMIVYYYELNSENLYRYTSPRPTASIVLPTEYASSGYFIFIPDIRYQIGYPAKGAYNAIMSGTDYLLKTYPQIDSTRMGLQGQSWGGYQTAQMITMTNRYKAAMAGAPVSNMFSAYGGIRWGSGMSRQFQYEHSQSRIGKTIWEAPELYVENSPVFHLPNVQTPVLIMHNDNDGAVPWYQGIEMYMGLRRLNKPVWMLNYNGDEHNLMKKGNRKDLSRRMKQFFDFYLNNGDEPDWMKEGVPAHRKLK